MSTVTNSQQRTSQQKLSERWSVIDFGAKGDGTTDDAPAINKAIAAASADGGHEIYFPGSATYLASTRIYISASMSNVTLVGDGEASVIKRGANITAGQGVIDCYGSNIGFRDLKIDGNVTTSVGLLYGSPGDFNNDPQNAALSTNTSFWIHGGKGIRFSRVIITHTGGYAILFDARDADILDARVESCLFENNRPHLFGVSSGDKNYGAWTGGILAQGDCRSSTGKLYAVRGLQVRGNRFHRMNGNCIWSHSYGFDTHHENFVIEGNDFAYIARDGYLAGNLIGGSCLGNTARYVGFRHSTDSDTPVGAYLANNYAVAYDCSGFVQQHTFSGNTVNEFYGGAFDLDGLRQSTVVGNTATSSQTIAKGLQTGDTSGNGGGHQVAIIGNKFAGCNAGAIVLNQADGCLCSGNVITHPAGASVVPILLYSLDKQTQNSTVRDNQIYYPADQWCVAESDGGTGTGFDATTVNLVLGNVCLGARGEFLKHPASGSLTGVILSTNSASATSKQQSSMQREGTGATSALKVYDQQSGTRTQYAQLQFSNGLWNVSEAGAVQTGIITTAARTTLGFKDAVWTGKLMTDGFLTAYDYAGASTSYQAADANALDANWALIRFNKTGGKWEQSVSVSAGARVWTDLASGLSGLTAGRVPYTTGATALADTANLAWNNTSRVLTVTGATGTASIVAATSYIQAAEGFYTTSTATTAIQAPNGGVTAKYLIGTTSLSLVGETSANAGLSATGQGRLYFDSSANKFRVSENGGAYVDLVGGALSGLTAGRIPYATGAAALGNTVVYWDNANGRLGVNKAVPGTTLHVGGQGYFDGAAAGAGLTVADGYVDSVEGYYSGFTSYQTFQAPNGGMYARSFRAIAYVQIGSNAGIPTATTGDAFGAGAMFWDSSAGYAKIYDGSSWVAVAGLTSINSQTGPAISISNGTGVAVSTTTNTVTISIGQAVGTSSAVSFYSVATTDAIQSNRSTGPAVYAPNAYIQGKGLVSSGLASYNSIQTDAGFSCGVGTGGGYYVSSTQVISTSGQFVGLGINCPSYGVAASGFDPYYSGTQYYGQNLGAVSVRRGDDAGSGTLTIYGGVIVAMSGL